jgi:hypothetical protein
MVAPVILAIHSAMSSITAILFTLNTLFQFVAQFIDLFQAHSQRIPQELAKKLLNQFCDYWQARPAGEIGSDDLAKLQAFCSW